MQVGGGHCSEVHSLAEITLINLLHFPPLRPRSKPRELVMARLYSAGLLLLARSFWYYPYQI
jgi:hypothetical protein